MKQIEVEWQDLQVSLNDYTSKHWRVRTNKVKKFHKLFWVLLNDEKTKFKRYTLTMEYNTRLDPTNTIAMVKIFEDYLKERGMIMGDTKRFCRGICITPNEQMKGYKITVKEV